MTDINGKVLENNNPQKGKQVLTEAQAFLISDILSDNNARKDTFGANSLLNIANVMVKTGTTNDRKDNWTIGGNANAMVGVWVGNNDNTSMLNVASGVSGASPIWRNIINQALKGKPAVKFEAPGTISQVMVDTVSGYSAHDNFPARNEYFIKGTEPVVADPIHVQLKICKNEGKLATPGDIAANNFDYKEYFQFKEEDPTAVAGGTNMWQQAVLNWLNTQSDSRYHPPSDYCGGANPLNIDFSYPTDNSANLPGSFTVTYTANSSSAITQSNLLVDGSTKCNSNSGSNSYKCDVSLSTGVHTLKAEATDASNHQSNRIITIAVGGPMPSPSPNP